MHRGPSPGAIERNSHAYKYGRYTSDAKGWRVMNEQPSFRLVGKGCGSLTIKIEDLRSALPAPIFQLRTLRRNHVDMKPQPAKMHVDGFMSSPAYYRSA